MTLDAAPDIRVRVAIALFFAKNGPDAKWDTFPERYKQGYLGLADAAISAMATVDGEVTGPPDDYTDQLATATAKIFGVGEVTKND